MSPEVARDRRFFPQTCIACIIQLYHNHTRKSDEHSFKCITSKGGCQTALCNHVLMSLALHISLRLIGTSIEYIVYNACYGD